MKRVNTYAAMSSEAQESNEKTVEETKTGDDKETDEHEEVEADDTTELKTHLVIKKDDDIAIDVIPLATKPPVIVDYKLLKEGIMVHYQLIRADGSSKRHSLMIRLLQGIDREDLQTLWKLVKTKHGDLRPEDEHERVLWGDLKVMFEPDIRSYVWRNLQGYKVIVTPPKSDMQRNDYLEEQQNDDMVRESRICYWALASIFGWQAYVKAHDGLSVY
ncbi:hypothetical protein Tco_1286941, partial [Tanacetum coccineum]